MSTVDESQPRRERTVLYVVVAILVGALVVVGLVAFRAADETRDAEAKAAELVTALEAADARTPSEEQIARVLGADGGATCESPNDALSQAALLAQLANGAAGPGSRPVIADTRILRGQLLIIEIYCPDQLERFREFTDSLSSGDVALHPVE